MFVSQAGMLMKEKEGSSTRLAPSSHRRNKRAGVPTNPGSRHGDYFLAFFLTTFFTAFFTAFFTLFAFFLAAIPLHLLFFLITK